MSDHDYKFTGWGAFGTDSIEGKLKQFEYEPKKWDEEDVDSKLKRSELCRRYRCYRAPEVRRMY